MTAYLCMPDRWHDMPSNPGNLNSKWDLHKICKVHCYANESVATKLPQKTLLHTQYDRYVILPHIQLGKGTKGFCEASLTIIIRVHCCNIIHIAASFPGLPHFCFAFSIIHGGGRPWETGKTWKHLSREWRLVDARYPKQVYAMDNPISSINVKVYKGTAKGRHNKGVYLFKRRKKKKESMKYPIPWLKP